MGRISFYIAEIEFMKKHDPRIPGNTLSYQQIADHLNKTWPEVNEGKRSRGTVLTFYNRLRSHDDSVVRVVKLPKAVSTALSGEDIVKLCVSHAVRLGTK